MKVIEISREISTAGDDVPSGQTFVSRGAYETGDRGLGRVLHAHSNGEIRVFWENGQLMTHPASELRGATAGELSAREAHSEAERVRWAGVFTCG